MKIKCENVIVCGSYGCHWNCDGRCIQDVVALDNTGKCALAKPRPVVKDNDKVVPESFDMCLKETSQ